jgi:putative (di)nucleoside polyphosphate hydrolase
MSAVNQLPLRPNVCMFLINAKGQILLGERFGSRGEWQLPQGGVDKGTPLEENVIRELNEELGIAPDKLKIIQKLIATHTYEFKDPPGYALGKWRGQSQTFWLVKFLGTDLDINLTLHHEQEFSAWQWCTPTELRTKAHPVRAPGYEEPLKEVERYIASM